MAVASGSSVADFFWRRSACKPSQRKDTYASPMAMENSPGRMKAMRQPPLSISKPVIKAAQATPRLPQTPFAAIRIPVSRHFETTMARPTG